MENFSLVFHYTGALPVDIDKTSSARHWVQQIQPIRGSKRVTQQCDYQLGVNKPVESTNHGSTQLVHLCITVVGFVIFSHPVQVPVVSPHQWQQSWLFEPVALWCWPSPKSCTHTGYTAAIGLDGFNPLNFIVNGTDTRPIYETNRKAVIYLFIYLLKDLNLFTCGSVTCTSLNFVSPKTGSYTVLLFFARSLQNCWHTMPHWKECLHCICH